MARHARKVVDIECANPEMLDLVRQIRCDCTNTRRSVEVVPVNKGELVDAIASSANISKTDAENALNAFIDTVQNSVSSGDKVTLPGFGSFQPTLRKARTGIDPRTREPVQIPERKAAKFSVGSKFKAQVQGS
jgi:DNA-binding protein HU-beta